MKNRLIKKRVKKMDDEGLRIFLSFPYEKRWNYFVKKEMEKRKSNS